MERQIKITVGELGVAGWLNETNTASKVWEALPIRVVSICGKTKYTFQYPQRQGWRMPERR